MKWLIIAFIVLMIYKNLGWIKYMWREYIIECKNLKKTLD